MRRIFIFIFLLSYFSFAISQTISINWDKPKTIDYGIQQTSYPFFTNEGYSVEGGQIYILVNQKNVGEMVSATNFKWQKISLQDLFELPPGGISENIISDITYSNDEKGQRYANINVSTIKREKNDFYRLTSFDIVKKSATTQKSKSSQRYGTTDNPLKDGTFYKIKVNKSGIFKITSQFLKDSGINPSGVNPKNFRIYGNGGIMLPESNQDPRYEALQENAIQVVGEEDGVWNDGDYALFYAQGPNGYNLYSKSNGNGYKRTETRMIDAPNNLKNIYEDYSYYFINFDKGAGKRVQAADAALPATLIDRYDDYQVINDDKTNLMGIGRTWVGDAFNSNKTVTFNIKSAIHPEDRIIYRTQVVGFKSQGNSIKMDINGTNEITQRIYSTDTDYRPLSYYGSITNLQGTQISLNYTPNISTNPDGNFFFDYAEVQYKEDLKFNGSQMNFRHYDAQEGSSTLYGFTMSNADSVEQIWDVSDITNAKVKINKSGTTASFNFGYMANSTSFNNEFVAFKNGASYTPSFVGKIDNQDLSSLQNVDYLIISAPEFISDAQRLATYHTSKENYNVQVVDVHKIYNEFSSGGQDITGIRDFVTKLRNVTGKLRYVLILGDTSYDYKSILKTKTNFVPSYESEDSGSFINSFVTDDYFVMTSTQSSPRITSNLPDLPIGRLPAASTSESKLLTDKTLAYHNNLPNQSTPFGEWRMKLDFVVDDDNDGLGPAPGTPFHTTVNKAIVANFETNTDKPEYNIRKLYLDSFIAQMTAGGQRYPQINQAITNDISNSLFLFYFGHGGINGWAQERVISIADVNNFNNFNTVYSRFPLISTITCEFTLWDELTTSSLGEKIIKLTSGGAATMITSSRAIDVSYGVDFSSLFINNIFKLYNDDFLPLGDSHLLAKKQKGANPNHLRVNFLGDPAMKISRPQRLITIDNIDSPVSGQLRALDFVKVKGHIKKPDGTIDNTFNGRVAINIFDKRLNKKTLNNDGYMEVLNYTEEENPIVKASGQAVNGVFEIQFYVPKDINYTVGNGRMLAYADNKVYDVFSNQAQLVGDLNPNGINDTEPPKVHLYMNNTNFANGGITNQNPMLLACVSDNTGINSTGSGIGHDITVILDGQVINTISLNDFYQSGEGNGCTNTNLADYQKGIVTYPFRDLTPGDHQLTFKVWDINNNSTTSTLNFIVKDEASQNLTLNKLLNWPNPFTDKTYIQFEHNCDDILDVNVHIYTITGKLVRTLANSVNAEPFFQGFRSPRQAIEWDGKDDFGDSVGKGTYIFKVFARSQNQGKCKGSATAVEKMVLLK